MPPFGKIIAMVVIIAVVVVAITYKVSTPASEKFNVILISVDSLRPDHMSLYGYDRQTTPHIDAWAKDAVVFDKYFSSAFLTPISEASVHTGDYPFTSGVINFESNIRESVPTMAQVFKENGWQTAAFLSSPEFYNYPALKSGFSRGFDTYTLGTSRTYYPRGSDPVVLAKTWIDGHDRKPFFLWLAIGSAHWPYGQDEPNHFSDPSYTGIFNTDAVKKWGLIWRDLFAFMYNGVHYSTTLPVHPVGSVTQKDMDYLLGRYDDGLVLTDRRIGALFDYLDKTGLSKNTVVILQSEHGEALGERGYIAHYDIFDESVHTPLIIKAPMLSPGRIKALVSGVDVMPTLLSLLNLPLPKMDGIDFSSYLKGASTPPPREEVFLSRTPFWERNFSSDQQTRALFFPSQISIDTTVWTQYVAADDKAHYYDTGIRTDKWKLIHRLARASVKKYSWWGWLTGKALILPEYELYDLVKDPDELHNVYSAHEGDTDVRALRDKLNNWESAMKARLSEPTPSQEIQPYF
ncbi:hypothetical protein EXS56_02280 [Candidatus Kaiserbacteria bacterium]|nr:hypothetical protein [Candidatus Kaiserbacteria bacterium]